MALRIALVANPESGGGVEAAEVEAGLRAEGARVERFSIGDERAAAASAPDRVAVAGGDGSIGPVAAAAAAADLQLAVIPVGTANDFARALGLPVELAEACALAANGGSTRRLEIARMDGRPFVNVASAGLAVAAAREASRWKKLLGAPAYALGALKAGLGADSLECRVRCDGHQLFEGRAWQVIVSSSGAFGGGSSVEVASSSDGHLDATVIVAGSRPGLVGHAYGLRFGRIVRRRGVRHGRCSEIEVSVAAETEFNVDGELVCHGSARFTIEPAAVAVVTP